MIDYNNVYIEQITKLYDDYLNSFKYKRDKSKIALRMQNLLKEICENGNRKYVQQLNHLSSLSYQTPKEKLSILTDIANLIKRRLDTINEYVTAYEEKTKSLLNEDFEIGRITSKLDEVENEIETLNIYMKNEQKIEELIKITEDTDVELAKIIGKKSLNVDLNNQMEFELNEVIKKVLSLNSQEELDENDIFTHYPQYQELYLKATEQAKSDTNITSVLNMARKYYLEYSKKKAILSLKSKTEQVSPEYQTLVEKRDTIKQIITEGIQDDTFTEIEQLLKEQYTKLETQLKDLKQEELLLTVKKNNEETIKKLKNQNEEIEKTILPRSETSSNEPNINNEKIIIEAEKTNKLPTDQEEKQEEQPSNADFRLVEVEPIEVIKNPFQPTNDNSITISKDIVTNISIAPNWLEYAIVENEHKFINWFDKLNALIKRKKYLKDE